MATPDAFAPVAITRRSGFDESVHFGAVVGLASSGDIAFAVGDPSAPIYPRSSNKPMQAVAMVRAGLQLAARPAGAGLRQPRRHADARRGGAPDPGDSRARRAVAGQHRRPAARPRIGRGGAARRRRSDGVADELQRQAQRHGGDQCDQRLADRLPDTCRPIIRCSSTSPRRSTSSPGEPHRHIGVDGCGSPAHVISLIGLARAFRTIATGSAGDAGDAGLRSDDRASRDGRRRGS